MHTHTHTHTHTHVNEISVYWSAKQEIYLFIYLLLKQTR